MAADPRDAFEVLLFVARTTAARGYGTRDVPVVEGNGTHDEPANLALQGAGKFPDGWRFFDTALHPYVVAMSDGASPAAGRAIRLAGTSPTILWGNGRLAQNFSAARWRGRRLVFSAAMRTEAARIGAGAQIAVKIQSKRQETSADAKSIIALQAGGPVRTSEWTRRSIAVDVPADAERISISLFATANSSVWIGDLKLGETDAASG
jgi:hypothetical protein